MTLLVARNLTAGYGSAQVLFGVDLQVDEGQVVTLLGRNGMGKTTTVCALMGLLKVSAGSIHFDGKDVTGAPSYDIARLGLGLVPEGRQVFPTLTVEENLIATSRPGKWDCAGVYRFFPRLAERKRHLGHQLSGGEQQMLAIGRALMTNPRLLILDEATEGLAPLVRAEIWQGLADLKGQGEAILVIDKNIEALTRLADHHFMLEKGRIVWQGSSAEIIADPLVIDQYLHL